VYDEDGLYSEKYVVYGVRRYNDIDIDIDYPSMMPVKEGLYHGFGYDYDIIGMR